MKELATLPASIRERLEKARSLAHEGTFDDAQQLAQSAIRELARTSPELCGLLLAVQAGYIGISWETVEEHTIMERVEYKIFGIPVKTEWVPVTDRNKTTKKLSVF